MIFIVLLLACSHNSYCSFAGDPWPQCNPPDGDPWEWSRERQSPPWPCWPPSSNAAQDTIGLPGGKHMLQAHVIFFIYQNPKILFCKAAFNGFFSQTFPSLHSWHGLFWCKCNSLHLALFNHIGQLFRCIQIPLDGTLQTHKVSMRHGPYLRPCRSPDDICCFSFVHRCCHSIKEDHQVDQAQFALGEASLALSQPYNAFI